MSKSKSERRLPEDKAMAKSKAIRTGARKLNMVAASIRGMNAQAAITQLTFEKRRVADEVKDVLQAAIANAENNHSLDVDRLFVSEAWTGRAFVMKRFRARARGRSASIEKPYSNLTIILQERKEEPKAEKAAPKKAAAKKVTTKKAAKSAAGA